MTAGSIALAAVMIFTSGCAYELPICLPSKLEPSAAAETAICIEPIDESSLPPIETARVSFVAAGDSIVHRGILFEAARRAEEEREFDFRPLFSQVADRISEADVAFINQETLMCGEGYEYSFYPTFNSPRQLAYDLIDVGFDVVSIANNHMCDKGSDGLRRTVEFWKSLGDVTMIGGFTDREDYERIRVIERNGISIALLAYTEETNGIRLGKSSPPVPYTEDETLKRHIASARELADAVIVSVHWGNENTNTPTENQRRLARLMADSGADVIIGHHPHVLQPVEWLETENGRTLCAYSIGNLYSVMAGWQNMLGGFLSFELVKMSDGKLYVDSPSFEPTVFYYGPSYTNTEIFLLESFTEEQARSHGTGNNYGSRTTAANMREYCAKVLGEFMYANRHE